MTTVIAYLGLGSNLDDRLASLREATRRIDGLPAVNILRVSPVYDTEPVGKTDQPRFLNAVAEVETTLSARDLLTAILGVEDTMGRVRTIRWGPRVIDIDLLLYGDVQIDERDLTVPHPRMHERAFVLVPLADLAPNLVPAGGRETMETIRNRAAPHAVLPFEGPDAGG